MISPLKLAPFDFLVLSLEAPIFAYFVVFHLFIFKHPRTNVNSMFFAFNLNIHFPLRKLGNIWGALRKEFQTKYKSYDYDRHCTLWKSSSKVLSQTNYVTHKRSYHIILTFELQHYGSRLCSS